MRFSSTPAEWTGVLSTSPRHRRIATAASVFVLATLCAYVAQTFERPVSSALVYLLGVLIIGAGWGLWFGVISAVAAALIYNFFLIQPLLQFSLDSADDYIPLIAFNLAALVSGALAGRLNDRARAAEQASNKLNLLLLLSRRLQETLDIQQIDAVLREISREALVSAAELYIVDGERIVPLRPNGLFEAEANRAFADNRYGDAGMNLVTAPLVSRTGIIGVLVHSRPLHGNDAPPIDWPAASSLLAIAIERALLFAAAAEKEALRKSEEFKSALLASVSHDLRTPLAAIKASATSLRSYGDQIAGADQRAMLEMIQAQCERLNRYTANLLSLGRLESAVRDSELDIVDLVDLLGVVLATVRSTAPERRLEKRLMADSVLIRGNPAMIEQVLLNVLDNALRYSEHDTPVLIALERGQDRATVAVTDQGRGVPPQDLERIFERFYRASSSSGAEGQGLGLSIAKGVTERFGGSIRAISPVEGVAGTRIEITFPLLMDKAA